ncbi:MAG: hypothetical protein J6S56_05415 [Bacteroidales bacterium]|nr:hypothetical protein [Bacteroidales bacterium]
MHVPAPTYRPFVPPREIPRRFAGCDGSGSPHTYGVRLAPCGSFATNPCRPTACIERTIPPPFTSTANRQLTTENWIYT